MKKEIVYGLLATGAIDLLALWTAGGEEIIKGGFVIAMCIVFALSCGIRLMLASCGKDNREIEQPTDWVSLGWYSIGAAAATALALLVVLC